MSAHAVESPSPVEPVLGAEAALPRVTKVATATLTTGAGGDSGKHAGGGRDLEPEWAAAIDAATD